MKGFFEFAFDFITGGFFNYLGALARKPFSKKTYKLLAEETMSNNIGMLVMTIFLFIAYAYYKFSS
jgi:hypothetical protein